MLRGPIFPFSKSIVSKTGKMNFLELDFCYKGIVLGKTINNTKVPMFWNLMAFRKNTEFFDRKIFKKE